MSDYNDMWEATNNMLPEDMFFVQKEKWMLHAWFMVNGVRYIEPIFITCIRRLPLG